ncbi:hypothetical protein [Nocardioides sp. NPDC047086]|uniref:hypothetical protein n=1 Tax=Nocardioides sp. NPDC047086 TaxID=3154810 RepID=UPI0033D93407
MRPRDGYFLRAESYYNAAAEIERLELDTSDSYGGVSLHERSHGDSFLDLAMHRFRPHGFDVLDDPEAALPVEGWSATPCS